MGQTTIFVTEADRTRLERTMDALFGGPAEGEPECVRVLRQGLGRATLLKQEQVPRNVVTMNSTVLLSDVETGDQRVRTLVYPSFSNLADGKISVLTPLGCALLGREIGDIVEYPSASGSGRLKVLDIVYQPEAEGEFFL